MADQNEYDAVASDFLGARKQQTEQNVKLNISNALSVNPDQAASIQKDANKLGVPVESAMANPDSIRKQSYFDSIDFSGIVDKLPATSQFFSNQNNANIAHDEVKGLTEIEKAAQTLGTTVRSLGRFAADLPAGVYAIGEGIAKTIADPLDWATGGNAPNRFRTWGNELEKLRKMSTQAGDMIQGDLPKDPGLFERNLYNAARSFGDQFPALVASIATKNPMPVLVSAGILQAGQSISESLDAGVAPIKALTRGIIDAGWEVMFEKYGVDKLLKDISLKSGFGKMLLGQIIREVPGELATTLMQQIDEYAITKPQASFNEFMQQLGPAELDTAVSTVIQTVMTAGLGHGVNRFNQKLDKANDAHQANSSFEVLSKLNDLISANKVKDRDIESFYTFMQSATQDSEVSHVYIEPKVMLESLDAAGVTKEQFAKEAPAIYSQLKQSIASNTDLAIPVADFATQLAGKDFTNSLIGHLRTDPNGMSQVEAEKYMAEHGNELKSEVENILGENSNMNEFHASKDRVKQAVLQNLNESTEWPAIKNENDAELIATRTAVRAAQLHMTPEELFQKHLLQVSSTSAQQSANSVVLNQAKNKIAEILATPNSKDNSKRVVPIAPVRNWLSNAIKEHTGKDVSKYHHQLDSYAINHTIKNHGNKSKEKSRGQVGITNEDLQMIPEIIDHPDSVILGTKNKKGQDQVFFVKQMPDGTALIVEEIRTGEKTLSVESMRKMAGTKYAKDLIPSVLPNVRNDTSAKPIVIENPDTGNSYNQSGIDQTETPEFKKWSHDLPVIEMGKSHDFKSGEGVVVQVLHGTTSDFDTFDQSKANIESDLGGGFYFTNTEDDVGTNYAGLGPDLTAKVQLLAERIASNTDREYDDPAVVKEAQEQFMQHEGMTMPVFVRFDNPVVLGGSNPTFLTYSSTYDEEYDDYSEPEGTLVDVMDALEKVANRSEYDSADAREAISAIYEKAMDYEGLSAEDFIKIASESEGLAYATDQNGVMANKEIIRLAFEMAGFDGFIDQTVNEKFGDARRTGKSMEGVNADTTHFIAFESTQIKSSIGNNGQFSESDPNILHQPARGQIAFGSDLSKSPSIITLLKSADLSTFLHESGHFFFESDIHLAAELNRTANETGMAFMTDGEQQIMSDVSKMLEWHGLQGTLNEQLNQWYTLSPEEKRSYHERTAESFERYLFEGKAPSIELQRIFQTFQAWLMQAYKSIQRFVESNPEAGQLNNEIRQVFDRMLATSEQIQLAEQSRSMMPLFSSADMAGMTEEEFAAYHNQDIESTLQARDTLQARGLRDMQWLQNARSKLIKKMQNEHKGLREEVMIDARRQILTKPIYQAYSFLTNRMTKDDKVVKAPLPKSEKGKVTPQVDSMLTAIAKLGGLKRDEISALMGIDTKMKNPMPAFGKYVFRNEGALSLDSMGELLAQYGYLPTDEHGKFDTRDLEDKLDAEFRGDPQYSIEVDDRILRGADKAGLGVDITGLGAGRLDLGELTGEFSPEIIAQLEALKMVSKNGIAPDFVAEQFGLGSADEMVRSLITIPSTKDAINSLTDQMMIERYGDISSPEALAKAADEAIHNDARAKFIATELNALNKAIGKPKVLTSAAKDFAQAMIDRLILRNLRPGQYSASEIRAGKAAEKAMREGNLEVAAAEKRNQIINNYATKAVYAAQKEVAQIRKFFSQILGGKDEDIAKYRDMDMVNAARAILAPLGYGGKATAAIDYLSRVKSYDPALHEVLISSVNAAQLVAKPIDDLTVEELRNIKEEVEALWHLSRRGKQMEIDGDLIDRQEAAEALVSRMQEIGLPENMPGVTSAITEQEVRKSRLQQFKAFLRRVESWVDLKDGTNKMGAFRKYVFSPIKDAANLYRQEKLEYITKFRAAFEGIAKTMEKGQIFASELNYTFGKDSGGVAMNEIMHAILHRGNDSNFRKLLLGRGWATLFDDGSLDTTRWDAFEKRMQKEGKLTKAHYDFAQSIWDLLEEMKPGAQKAHRDAYGRYFAEVTATSFNTPFGMYRGGYVPAKVDSRIVKDMELKKLIEEGKDGMMFAFPSTNKGFTKSRVEYNRPLMLDLRTIAQHIDQVLLFTHMENPSRDVAKLIGMPEVSEPLNQQDPEAINSMLTPWLTRSAKQLVTTPVAGAGGLMRFFSVLRSRTSMAAMFANISNTAQQITGFTLAGVKVGTGSMLSSAAQYISNPKQMTEDVGELSMYMAHRMDNQVSAMLGDIQEILLNPSLFEKSQEWTKKHTFFMQSAVDNVMGTIIWQAAFNEAIEDGHQSDDSVKIADGIVRQTQGSSLPEDISRMETGNAFVRMFTLFAGYFNMQANLLGTEFAKIAQEMGMRKGMGRGFYVMLMGFAAPAIVSEMIAQAFRGGPDDDDKDGEYLDDWLMAVLVYGPIKTATAFVPGGSLINSAVAKFNHNPADDKMSITPVMNSLDALASIPVDLWKAEQGKANAQKIVRDISTVIAVTVGLPANIVARPLGYLAGVDQGKISPTSDLDMARGLITGAASPESKKR